MKQYPQIMGPNKAPRSDCIAFYKYDGSNIRCEWSKKRGWYKFGSRKVLIDKTSPLGDAIDIFLNTYGEPLSQIFTDNKQFRETQNVTVFLEYFGNNSFAGQHDPDDEKKVILLDVSIHKKGIMSPIDFLRTFYMVDTPPVIYTGNFSNQFIQEIKNGKHKVNEGVVVKGNCPKRKKGHNLWMAKCKTKSWIERLKKQAEENPEKFATMLKENIQEQKNDSM